MLWIKYKLKLEKVLIYLFDSKCTLKAFYGVLRLLAIAARFDVQYCTVVVKLRKVSVIKKYFLVTLWKIQEEFFYIQLSRGGILWVITRSSRGFLRKDCQTNYFESTFSQDWLTWWGGTTLWSKSSLLAMAAQVESNQQSPRIPCMTSRRDVPST